MIPLDASLSAALSPWQPGALSLAAFALLVAGLVLVLLLVPGVLNPARTTPEKSRPYECGVIPTPEPGFRYPAPFALVAIDFLVFDVETAFIFTWAVSFQAITWHALAVISAFIGVLLISLWYLWMKGGLHWGGASR